MNLNGCATVRNGWLAGQLIDCRLSDRLETVCFKKAKPALKNTANLP